MIVCVCVCVCVERERAVQIEWTPVKRPETAVCPSYTRNNWRSMRKKQNKPEYKP